MQTNEYDFSDSHLIRHCRKKYLTNGQPNREAFLINRKKENYMSFNCLEMICCDPWDLVDDRPKAINKLEPPFPLSTKDVDLWAISHCNVIMCSIQEAVQRMARKLGQEYEDVCPTVCHKPGCGNPSHVGVKWNSQAVSVPENALDLAIANRLATSVELTFPAKNN